MSIAAAPSNFPRASANPPAIMNLRYCNAFLPESYRPIYVLRCARDPDAPRWLREALGPETYCAPRGKWRGIGSQLPTRGRRMSPKPSCVGFALILAMIFTSCRFRSALKRFMGKKRGNYKKPSIFCKFKLIFEGDGVDIGGGGPGVFRAV